MGRQEGNRLVNAQPAPLPAVNDDSLVRDVQRGSTAAFGALMRRYNRRLYRTARAILKDDALAEDALQDAYLAAFRHIDEFRGDAALGTWLTRIVVNQALQALRRTRRERIVVPIDGNDDAHEALDVADAPEMEPDNMLLRAQTRRLIERTIDALPDGYRTVFVLREVEDLTVDETATALGIPAATVRTRLFRAKARLREMLSEQMDVATQDAFSFDGERCDRIVRTVLARVEALVHPDVLPPRK
jgi:RNA polymerase sigma-70 factor (ECF subfamily)